MKSSYSILAASLVFPTIISALPLTISVIVYGCRSTLNRSILIKQKERMADF
jgi:hypothetical protein